VTVIAAVNGVLPPHRYAQQEITETFAKVVTGAGHSQLLRRIHASTHVRTRHLVLPLEEYARLRDFGESNDVFVEKAVELGAAAVANALNDAGLRPEDVDLIVSTTVTGLAVPSIEARIAMQIGLRPDVKRLPLFGLGCVAGAAGIARIHDYLRGAPDDVAVLLAVELCSLTVQRDDASIANIVASGLFGDGAAAVVAVGTRRAARDDALRAGPVVVDSRSRLYPGSTRTMGWDIAASGFRIVLNAEVPALVTKYLGEDVRGFLAGHNLSVDDVTTWISHPGGPKVIDAIQAVLGLPPDALELTWRSLAEVGNLSSASVLHVLRDTIDKRPPSGSPAVLMAMGPGFCSELALLRWR
jgi:alkylresorcinol/alkylpyrone synthase